MPHPLEGLITRLDIVNIAVDEKLVLDDEERVSILEAMRTIDVQACPGSGKTTLIAAKLILLAKKWPFQNQGVCVLSHTNVAKNEILNWLKRSNTIEAHRLLSYPHFIGTIQDFVNRFLALPYIRSNGIKDITVDNSEYAKQAEKLLKYRQFSWFQGTLNGLGGRDQQEAFLRETYRFTSPEGEKINISKKPREWKKGSNLQRAERDLGNLKRYLDERGFFLFRDMYTHARIVCSCNVALRKSLTKRFPFVFIDEMQDTQKYQDELLCKIFPLDDSSHIIQRFGDPDQAIFHSIGSEEPNVSFNGKSRDDMDFVINKSHRFDGVLADKIKSISFNEIPLKTELSAEKLGFRTKIHATEGHFEHTIIVFDDDTLDKVIESFAQIVSNQFSIEYKNYKKFTVKAVGAVGKEIDPGDSQLRIGHYWNDYDKSKSNTKFQETNLMEAVLHCRRSSDVDWAEKYKFLTDCILKLMRMAGRVDENQRYFSYTTFRDSLKADGRWGAYRENIFLMLSDGIKIDQCFWGKISGSLKSLLALDNIQDEAAQYIAFTEDQTRTCVIISEENPESNLLVSLKDNKISHPDGFQIELSTIHGVKGETHDATLIVETKNHIFDLETMLPYLTGELPNADHPNSSLPDKPHSRRVFKPNKVFMRQLYVAMSRPRHLLCLALHSDRLSATHMRLLLEKGWKTEVLSPEAERAA
ncbi:UvrD-helicase domain-containing protein [Candidatus Roizmanbacteria bacterium]|nr:UvrD-helicase domain-containing protein [Candidatus Roizmanbacteria bacterium]